jgi:hypothetical protein
MNNISDQLKQRMAALNAERTPEPDSDAQQTPERKKPAILTERTKLVRRSVDLSPNHHRKLTEWCAETASEIGAARVTGADVFRTLVARLLTDETLARKVRADLRDELNQR